MAFSVVAKHKKAVALKTLRAGNSKDVKDAFDKSIPEEQINLAKKAGFDGLVELTTHEHPRIKALAGGVVENLRESDNDEVALTDEIGLNSLVELASFKKK